MSKPIQLLLVAITLGIAQSGWGGTAEQKCAHRINDCEANVHVTAPIAGAACQASIGSGKIRVGKGIRTRHVWKIIAKAQDKGRYEWDIANGIEILSDKDQQILDKGINKKGHFWVLNANSVPGSEIEYIAHVRLIAAGGQSQPCTSVDPKIINDN